MARSDDHGSGDSGNAPSQMDSDPTRRTGDQFESVSADGGRGPYDRVFSALGRSRRRYVLYYLERCEPATIEEIAHHVAAWEAGRSPADLPEGSETVRAVTLSLYHDHLARLDDLGFVECDLRNGDVRFRECPELLLEVLEVSRPRELPDPPFETV